MRRARWITLLLSILLVGCGGARHGSPRVTYTPPQSARIPDGAQPQAPPPGRNQAIGNEHISGNGLLLVERFEGYARCAYWDPFGRVWTVGFGQTEGVTRGFCLTGRAQAQANLRTLIETRYEWALRALGVSLNQNRWDALCSFVWNLGAGIFGGTTLGAELRARNWRAAASQMLAYDHAGGVVLPGLQTRRQLEVRLFLTPVPIARPKPKPRPSPRLVTRWRLERRAVLHRYHLAACKPSSTGPRCTAWRRQAHRLAVLIRARS